MYYIGIGPESPPPPLGHPHPQPGCSITIPPSGSLGAAVVIRGPATKAVAAARRRLEGLVQDALASNRCACVMRRDCGPSLLIAVAVSDKERGRLGGLLHDRHCNNK
jgi:hypothetical protein